MSVVISSDLVLTGAEAGLTLDHPIVGWRNIVAAGSVAAETSAASFPVSNVANPATFLKWIAGTNAEQHVTITTGTADPIDYVAIARHNLSSTSHAVSIEAGGASPWTELTAPVLLPNDGPALFRFNPISTSAIRIRLQAGVSPAEIAVVYCGKLLVLQRRIYAGHTPMPQGRTWKATDGMSESGQFLGRIVLQEFVKSKIALSLLTPAWYRANFDEFVAAAIEEPFFFAWRPQTYPNEVGYGWLTSEPAPAPATPSNLISVSLDVTGVT